jgi:hypothetical protein
MVVVGSVFLFELYDGACPAGQIMGQLHGCGFRMMDGNRKDGMGKYRGEWWRQASSVVEQVEIGTQDVGMCCSVPHVFPEDRENPSNHMDMES